MFGLLLWFVYLLWLGVGMNDEVKKSRVVEYRVVKSCTSNLF